MKVENKEYCDTSRVYIDRISKNSAKRMIVKHHYTHKWSLCKFALGIFYDTQEPDVLGNKWKLIGCIVYGGPVGRNVHSSICEGITTDNVIELTRLYCHDGYGSNIESYAIAQSFKWISENMPEIKVLVSYADPDEDHNGTIYQATNWLYQGTTDLLSTVDTEHYYVSIQKDPYDWIHSRTVIDKWGTTNLDNLKIILKRQGIDTFWRKKISRKHRYLKFINVSKRQRKNMIKSLKFKTLPYPKHNKRNSDEIEVYDITDIDIGVESNVYW